MAGDVVVGVKGVKELRRALRQIEDKATRKGLAMELRSEFRTAARVVELAAHQEVPKLKGTLAASIKSKGTTTGAAVTVGGTARTRHAGPIHWGWPSRPNKARRWRGGPIKANPFLVRAAERSQDQVADAIGKGLKRWIDKVADTRG